MREVLPGIPSLKKIPDGQGRKERPEDEDRTQQADQQSGKDTQDSVDRELQKIVFCEEAVGYQYAAQEEKNFTASEPA